MKSFKYFIALLILITQQAPVALANETYTPLDAWKGEFLPKDYGAFYIKIRQTGFKKNSRGQFLTSNVFLHLKELPHGKHYIVSQSLGTDTTGQQPVWKLPIGNYLLHKISLSDNSGINRSWLSSGKPLFSVRHLFLSNLGTVVLNPGANNSLSATFQPGPNTFINSYEHEAFAAVIDGYTQKIQKKLGGSELFSKAEDNFSTGDEARAAFSQQRQIAMMYKVELEREQKYAKKIAGTLAGQDLDLRTCYMDQLDKDGSLQGNMAFRFEISKSDGTMQNIKLRGGSLKSKNLAECLYLTLGKMQFPLARSLSGQVTFYFNFKDDIGRAEP